MAKTKIVVPRLCQLCGLEKKAHDRSDCLGLFRCESCGQDRALSGYRTDGRWYRHQCRTCKVWGANHPDKCKQCGKRKSEHVDCRGEFTCKACEQVLPLTAFPRDRLAWRHTCRPCLSSRRLAQKLLPPEQRENYDPHDVDSQVRPMPIVLEIATCVCGVPRPEHRRKGCGDFYERGI